MKKLIIIIAVTLIAAVSANAQLYKGFGIKAGTSISNQQQNLDLGGFFTVVGGNGRPQYKYGLTLGIFKEINIIQNLKTQIGINYSQKGSIVEYDQYNSNYSQKTGNTYSVHYNLNFFTAEIYAKYTSSNSIINPYILAGIRMDFYSSQHLFTKSNGNETDFQSSLEITNNKILGLSIGTGAEYQASKLFSLFLEATYNPDFNYLTDINNEYYSLKIRGHSFDIRTGIKF